MPRINARVTRLLQVFIAGLLLCWIAYVVYVISLGFGIDYLTYMGVAQRVLAGGPVYTPDQVAGPHVVTGGLPGDNMYPPTSLPLFLAFGLLPQPISIGLWYAIPLTVVAWHFAVQRPRGWRLVACLALFAYPPSTGVVFLGNPALWVVAALCLASRWPFAAAFVLLKPSLLPFAFVGIRDRRWWLAVAGFGGLALLLLPLTIDYVRVLLNARGMFSGIQYSLPNVPIMLIPFVAGMKKPAPAEAEAGGVVAG